MNRTRTYLAGALALAGVFALPQAANAADYDTIPADWNGFYAGVHAGFGWFDASGSFGAPVNLDASGAMGGVLLGYNWDLGNYVAGLEADASFGGQSDTQPVFGFGALRLTNHGQHTFRARLGLETGTSGLLYVTGGLALADFWGTVSSGARDKDFLVGGVVGAGYEAMLTEDISIRGEYLYANYGNNTFSAGGDFDLDVETHTIRAGVAWRF